MTSVRQLPTTNTDELVWCRFKDGSERDFAVLFERYGNLLLNYGLTVESDRDLVKDAIQELFITLWQQRQQLATVNSVKFYLISSLRRSLLRQKKSLRRERTDQEAYWLTNNDAAPPADSPLLVSEQTTAQARVLTEAVNQLPKRQREAIFLRFYEAMSYDDIGIIMSLNYQVVRNLVHRAVKSLRGQLTRFRPVFFDALLLVCLLLTGGLC
jgi:RNA polymerase sigma factor (sigma-70 family)